jgi:hypothetical protein
MRRYFNRDIGARVIVNKVVVDINFTDKIKTLRNVGGTIVDKTGLNYYFHNCLSDYVTITKVIVHNVENICYAVKLDDNIKDIDGNNIILVKKQDLKFLDYLEPETKKIV